MQFCLLILSLLSGIALGSEGNGGKHWAVLVAGSNGWYNYRHQADLCHSYQLLRKNGIPPENIVTMLYDDVANDPQNPFPGKIFNDYKHIDVYKGVEIDYRGEDVTPDNFIRVLKGDRKLKESGFKVLESGPEDNVFVFFTDHGSPNMIMFPNGELYADQLNETLAYMNKARMYKKLVLYVEACFSGSMFRRILPKNIDIFAMTAANATESSYAAFCYDPTIENCLADDFSYRWMTDTEKHQRNLSKWTIGKQFQTVKRAVNRSHVQHYGDQLGKMAEETINEIVEEVTSRTTPAGTPVDVKEHLNCYQKIYGQYKNKCFSVQQVPEVAKELVKLDHLCEQGYDANVVVQAIFTTCG
ncbi:Legumain [Fasciola gigantica]|uniref:Hemoglobinase n=1 Tax=Fasciola gigantica TaxID=46835 RepID=A0A504YLR7_FASGI|nr:Legumain [Fasciola gigantica]